MKNFFLLLLLSVGLLFTGCKDDDDSIIDADLHWDGPNFSAPLLDAGTYEAAARFTAGETGPLKGKLLDEVEFWIQEKPAACELIIYGEGTGSTPGPVLYSVDLSDEIAASSWNVHPLSTPLEIAEEDLWLTVRVRQDRRMSTVGCDPGPRKRNGDWIIQLDGAGVWESLLDFTNDEVSINWNIRGHVAD